MRLVRGPTLKGLITARELDPRRSLQHPARRRRRARHRARAGLVHRDVKPSERARRAPRPRLPVPTSGSRSSPARSRASLTKTDHVVGTLDYIAPEQIRGQDASPASDVYAFAAVLYETLTGQVPFPRRDRGGAAVRARQRPAAEGQRAPARSAARDSDRCDRRGPGQAARPSGPPSPLELVEHAEALLAGSRAGVPSLPPTDSPLARPTVADTPPRAACPPLPAFASTVGDFPPGPPAGLDRADVAALEPAARATVTDADAGAAVARPTVTDADAPVARPTVTDAETPVARGAPPRPGRSRTARGAAHHHEAGGRG